MKHKNNYINDTETGFSDDNTYYNMLSEFIAEIVNDSIANNLSDLATNTIKYTNIIGPSFGLQYPIFKTADNFLTKHKVTDKNYLTLSSFWGGVAWKAISQIESSTAISSHYKAPIKIASAAMAVGMTIFGADIFASSNNNSSIDSIKLVSKFFDDKNINIISRLEQKFSQNTFEGIKYAVGNFNDLISNKFIANRLKIEALNLLKFGIIYNFFKYLPEGINVGFMANKQDNWMKFILKISLMKFVKQIIELGFDYASKSYENEIDKKIENDVINEVFDTKKTLTIQRNISKINSLHQDINDLKAGSSKFISEKCDSILKTFIMSRSNSNNSSNILDTNATNFLLEVSIHQLFTGITELSKIIGPKIYKEKKFEDHSISEKKSFGGGGEITFKTNLSKYAFENLSEIFKFSANEFIRKKLQNNIENSYQINKFDDSKEGKLTSASLNALKSIVEDFLYASLFAAQKMDEETSYRVYAEINSLKSLLGLNQSFGLHNNTTVSAEEVGNTLDILSKNEPFGVKRSLSKDNTLSIKNYELACGNSPMLKIDNLEFKAGKIYAIIGKIGTGKTTFLSDIAKCMTSSFSSTGIIEYPTYDNKECKLMFTGAKDLTLPVKTLFDKITYRLPEEYINTHRDFLKKTILKLFAYCGQKKGIDEEKLMQEQEIKLSTGQEKLSIIFPAILYKAYLEENVLLIMDETLANLDEGTTEKVCELIKKIFSDSIIIAVDHGAQHNKFYEKRVDLETFSLKSEKDEVSLISNNKEKDEISFDNNKVENNNFDELSFTGDLYMNGNDDFTNF